MVELKGFYNEAVLHDLLDKAEIGHLDYVMHLDENTRDRYKQYCSDHGLELNEQSAEQFFQLLVEQENREHERNMR